MQNDFIIGKIKSLDNEQLLDLRDWLIQFTPQLNIKNPINLDDPLCVYKILQEATIPKDNIESIVNQIKWQQSSL